MKEEYNETNTNNICPYTVLNISDKVKVGTSFLMLNSYTGTTELTKSLVDLADGYWWYDDKQESTF